MNTPLVSIVISAYNAEKYIGATIRSVLAQTWRRLEIIIVNDGSTDDTVKVISEYPDRIKLISQLNRGQDAALNEGFRHSTGSYIKFMDSDDLLNPEMIERQVTILNGSLKHIAYGEWDRFFNDRPDKAIFKKMNYWKDMLPLDFLTAEPNGVMLQCGIMLLPRELIIKAGLWDERLILFNDTEFFNRIILASEGIKFSEGARLYYRSGMLASISAGRKRKFYESTFLATSLIEQQLLEKEDSVRIRTLISNTYLMQYYHMYPKFRDLIKLHEKKIRQIGHGTQKPYGGKLFQLLSSLFGWRLAKMIQFVFYEAGYLKLLYWFRKKNVATI